MKCPKCSRTMPMTIRHLFGQPFSRFFNCPDCHPELEEFRPVAVISLARLMGPRKV
jgi:hypothetical protein